jgi:hypothetical protein
LVWPFISHLDDYKGLITGVSAFIPVPVQPIVKTRMIFSAHISWCIISWLKTLIASPLPKKRPRF